MRSALKVDLFRKIMLRKQLYSKAQDGAIYVPFIGDGDIAKEIYKDKKIYGADLDPCRVKTARVFLSDADIRVADCNKWPFQDIKEKFAVADLDSYCNPYLPLIAFWNNAEKTKRVVVFGTDGMKQRIARGRCMKSLPSGDETPSIGNEYRVQYNFWWQKHVIPFIEQTISPSKIIEKRMYQRGMGMIYWGVIINV